MPSPYKIVYGTSVRLFFNLVYFSLFVKLIQKVGIKQTLPALKRILQLKDKFTINTTFHKYVKHENKIYINCNIPSIPFSNFIDRLIRFSSAQSTNFLSQIGIVQIGFTKKCALNCEHCYEGKVLNNPEKISLEEHQLIVAKLQENDVPMIQFGGGEPLNRFDDLLAVLSTANKKTSEFWIYSSGYGLNLAKAKKLKESGLTGIVISIDHFEEAQHNAFRRNPKSFEYAINAVKYAQHAGLLTALSICVTKSFCTLENLEKYHEFAHNLNVPFVQLLEPRAVGNYEGQHVELNEEEIKIIETFYTTRNSNKKFSKLPIIQYTGYQQRTKGCGGAGNIYIYIDTDGQIQSCPFCKNTKSHFLAMDTNKDLAEIKNIGCSYIKN
jgi:MoaA/NifB/PqqE/SkfB family radical SAM enzyme